MYISYLIEHLKYERVSFDWLNWKQTRELIRRLLWLIEEELL